jgi:ParB-like chromosome segregation protein Spo0J
VCRHTGEVIDGHHRLAAARLIGLPEVPSVYFDGAVGDAFIEAVQRNVQHGLPLSLDEKKAAASRILTEHPEWSDRRIAGVCALSPRTVGRLRAASGSGNAERDRRVGLDGRVRLVRPEFNRLRIVDAVQANPAASLRSIAEVVGSSVETVRRVRRSLNPDNSPAQESKPRPLQRRSHGTVSAATTDRALRSRRASAVDSALISTSEGRQFAEWFDRTDQGGQWHCYVMAVPLSRVYEVADEARRRALVWSEFANLIEGRSRM